MALALRDAAAPVAGGPGGALPLSGDGPLTIGSLPTSGLCLAGPGIEPIHCLVEPAGDGRWRLVDLGTPLGVLVNGQRVEVEAVLAVGDVLAIGPVRLTVVDQAGVTVPAAAGRTVLSAGAPRHGGDLPTKRRPFLRPLFVSRQSRTPLAVRPEGDAGKHLEVVAYWGDTVLNVDHFRSGGPGDREVTIGDPTKAHFLSGGRDAFAPRVLAALDGESCLLRLGPDMRARLRQDGALSDVDGKRRPLVVLGPRDFAHVQHGAVHYFLHFAALPRVDLPAGRRWDRLLTGLGMAATLLYAVLVTIALVVTPSPKAAPDQPPPDFGPWQTVHVEPLPRHVEPPRVEPKPPTHRVAQPPRVEPKPPVQPRVEPKPPLLAQRPPQPVATAQVVPPTPRPTAAPVTHPAAAAPSLQPPTPSPSPTRSPRVAAAPAVAPSPSPAVGHLPGAAGAPGATGAHTSDVAAGGPGRDNASPAPLKGQQRTNHPGVEGATRDQPSLPNLKNLGIGLGPVLGHPGGLHTELRDSTGGIGGKAGTASRDYGLGGPGGGSPLALPGSGGRLGGWTGGPSGGLGGPSLGRFGHGPGGDDVAGTGPGGGPGGHLGSGGHAAANVTLPPGDPLTTPQGLTYEEISQVIRQHLNEIRHCYEQVLQRSPQASGKMKVGFAIGLSGRVESVTVEATTIDDPMFRACVTGKIQRWAFPHPRGTSPVRVTYPFLFNPL